VLNANGFPATIAAGQKSQFDVLADGELLFSNNSRAASRKKKRSSLS
jgi:hypothetical protein